MKIVGWPQHINPFARIEATEPEKQQDGEERKNDIKEGISFTREYKKIERAGAEGVWT